MIEFNFVSNGLLHDFWTTGMAIFTGVIIVANLELLSMQNSHSTLSYFFIFGSIGAYLLVLLIFSSFRQNPLFMCLYRLLVTYNFYFYIFAAVYACCGFKLSLQKIMRSSFLPQASSTKCTSRREAS